MVIAHFGLVRLTSLLIFFYISLHNKNNHFVSRKDKINSGREECHDNFTFFLKMNKYGYAPNKTIEELDAGLSW